MKSADDSNDQLTRLQDALAGVWSIERELGRGGMATVYLARDVSLDRPVALKVLHEDIASQPALRERFLGEARTGARLSHPNIVPIFAVDEQDGFVYFVMGLVDGETLGARLRREGPIPPAEAERVLREVGWALGYAHAMGLVHRDVTLENVLLERNSGRVVLADFGIAAEVQRVGEGPLLGTPAYLAPELIQGGQASVQSDIYALGILGWAMLAGRLPYLGEDSADVLLQHLTAEIPSLARAAPATPSRVVRMIELALSKTPERRSKSIEEWIALLDSGSSLVNLAPPLRSWLNSWETARPFYALGALYLAVSFYDSIGSYGLVRMIYDLVRRTAAHGGLLGLGILLSPLIIHLGVQVSQARKLARAGYGPSDLQLALERARMELARTQSRMSGFLGRIVRDIKWLALAVYLLVAVFGQALIPGSIGRKPDVWFYNQFLNYLLGWSGRIFLGGLTFNILIPGSLPNPNGIMFRFKSAFWGSRLGAGFMQLASFGLPRLRSAEATLHRPTELVLDLAIEDLWSALPDTTRRGLHGLPALAAKLRRRVADIKALERSIADAPQAWSKEIAEIQDRLAERHQAGVTALERLRLLLGKLGGAVAPEGEFSEQLASARHVEQELLEELGAHKDLRKLLKRKNNITPAMTPA